MWRLLNLVRSEHGPPPLRHHYPCSSEMTVDVTASKRTVRREWLDRLSWHLVLTLYHCGLLQNCDFLRFYNQWYQFDGCSDVWGLRLSLRDYVTTLDSPRSHHMVTIISLHSSVSFVTTVAIITLVATATVIIVDAIFTTLLWLTYLTKWPDTVKKVKWSRYAPQRRIWVTGGIAPTLS
jgi:hypothetical protein